MTSVIQGYIKKGYTVTGETYEELAKEMGVDDAAALCRDHEHLERLC